MRKKSCKTRKRVYSVLVKYKDSCNLSKGKESENFCDALMSDANEKITQKYRQITKNSNELPPRQRNIPEEVYKIIEEWEKFQDSRGNSLSETGLRKQYISQYNFRKKEDAKKLGNFARKITDSIEDVVVF